MSTVDNRVVRMTFDNAQFERGIKSTMKVVEDFEKSLKLDGVTAGFDKLKSATDKLNLSGLSGKMKDEVSKVDELSSEASKSIDKIDDSAANADFSAIGDAANAASIETNDAISNIDISQINDGTAQAAEGFDALGTVAMGVLIGIGEQISNLVTGGLASIGNTIKQFTIDPITQGFKEYETQMGSIQTIMANTNLNFSSDEDIALVNSRLDELNTYADKTIYNFTEMTKNIGTFTAAGVGLDESTKAIQGIANMAALSGSNSQQASTAMYQLSQAMAAGTVKLQDWNSVVNAGMGGQVFQEALKRTARAHGIAVDEMIAANGSFRESLQEGWISTDILTETLNQMAISYEKVGDEAYNAAYAELTNAGYSDDDAKAILKLAKNAELAATEVRTWTQLWDTVGEAIGSNWSQIWRNVIGDFKQATDTFTFLSDTISSAVDGLLGNLVHASEIFNKSGAIGIIFGSFERDAQGERIVDDITGTAVRIKGAIDYLVEAIGKPLGAIKDAFDSVFGMGDDELGLMLTSLSLGFKDFAQSLVISDDAAQGIRQIFEGLFSIIDFGIHIVSDLVAAFFSLVDAIRTVTDPLVDIGLNILGQVGKVIVWVHDRLLEVRAAIIEGLQPLFELINTVKDAISAFFGFADVPDKINTIGDAAIELLNIIWKFIDIPGKLRGIGDMLKTIFGFIGNLTGWNSAVDESNRLFETTGERVSALDIWIQKLLENPVVNFFKGILDAVLGLFKPIKDIIDMVFNAQASGDEAAIANVWGEIRKSVEEAFGPVKNFIDTVGNSLGSLVDLVFKLVESIGGFVSKIGEAILSFEPIKNVVDILNGFKDGAINFFLSLPDRLAGTASGIDGELGGIQGIFNRVFTWFNDTINYFNTVSVEQFIEDIKSWANGIVENVQNVFNYLTTTSPSQILEDLSNKISEAFGGMLNPIKEYFPEMVSHIENGFGTIKTFFSEIAQESESIPDFFIKLFKKIGTNITQSLSNIIDALKNFTPEVFYENWKNAGKVIRDTLVSWFPSLAPQIDSTINSIDAFFKDITSGANNWLDVLKNIGGKIGEALKGLVPIIQQAFVDATTAVVDALISLTSKLEELPGPFGQFFGMIKDVLVNSKDTIVQWAADLPEKIKSAFSSLGSLIDGALEQLKRFWDGFKIESVPQEGGSFVENIKAFFEGKFGELKEFFGSIPDRIGDIIAGLEELMNNGTVQKIIEFIKTFLVLGLVSSLSSFVTSLSKLANAGANYLNSKAMENYFDGFKKVATGFGIIAGALWVVSQIPDPAAAAGILVGVGAVVTAMEAISAKVTDKWGKGGTQLLAAAGSLGLFAISMLAVMYTIQKLTAFDWAGNVPGIIAMGVALGILTGILTYITKNGGNGGKQAIQAAAGILIMVFAINMLVPAIESLTNLIAGLDEKGAAGLVASIIILGGAIAGISFALTQIGDNGPKAGIGFLLVSIGLSLIASSVAELAVLPIGNLIASLIVLGGLLAEFAIIADKTEAADLVGTGAGILVFSIGIAALAMAVGILADKNWEGVAAAGVALGILLAALGLIAKFTEATDLIATSAGILVFGIAIAAMALGLKQLAEMDIGQIAAAAIAIGALLVVLGVAAGVLANIPGSTFVILALAAAFVALGAAAWLIAEAISIVTDSFLRFVAAGPMVMMFLQLFADNLPTVLAAAAGLAVLGVALIPLGAGLLVFGAGALVAGAGLLVLTAGISSFLFLMENLPESVNGAVNGIVDFITHLPEKFKEMWDGFVIWVTETAIPGIVDFLSNIISNLGEFLVNAWNWFTTEALPKLGEMLGQFWNWVTTEGLPKLGEFLSEIFNKLGEFLVNFGTWVVNEGLPKLGEMLGQFWNWVTTEGLPKLGEFIVAIFGKLGEALGNLGQWFVTEALPAIGKMLTDLLGKLAELGPKLLELIGKIPGLLAEGIRGIWQNILNIGGDIAEGIAKGLGDGAQAIINAVTGLGQTAMDSIKNFFGIASPSKKMRDEVGRYLSEGIASGILLYSNVAEAAAIQMGQNTVAGIDSVLSKAAYNITNPSITPVVNTNSLDSSLSSVSSVANMQLSGDFSAKANLTGELLSDGFLGAFDMLIASIETSNSTQSNEFNSTIAVATNSINVSMNNNANNLLNELQEFKNMQKENFDSTETFRTSTTEALVASVLREQTISDKLSNLAGILYDINNGIEHVRQICSYELQEIDVGTWEIYSKLNNGMDVNLDTNSVADAVTPRIDGNLGQLQVASEREFM